MGRRAGPAARLTAGQRGGCLPLAASCLRPACCLPPGRRGGFLPPAGFPGCWAPAGRCGGGAGESNKSGGGEESGRRRRGGVGRGGGASRPAPENLSDKWQTRSRARCSFRRAGGSRGGLAPHPALLPPFGCPPATPLLAAPRCGAESRPAAGRRAPPLPLESVGAGCGLFFYLPRFKFYFIFFLNYYFAFLSLIFSYFIAITSFVAAVCELIASMGGGGKEIKGAAAEGCKSAPGKSRGAAGRDGSGKPGSGKPGCGGGERCGSALAALLSALAAASCVYLGVRTSDLQARVAAIEGARGGFSAAAPLPPLPGFSLEQLNAMMQEKVERLLAQVCGTGVSALSLVRVPGMGDECAAAREAG